MKRSFHFFLLLTTCIGVALVALPSPQLLAQSDEVSQLRQRVGDLEQKIQELEKQLNECNDTQKTQQIRDYGSQNKKNWRSLEVGMKEDKVRHILGEPVKVIKGVKTLWYYPNFYGGHVSFDEKGRLAGWNEP